MSAELSGDHYGQPIHPIADDQWGREVQPGLTVAVDSAGCIVVHTPHGTFTVSDVRYLAEVLLIARDIRDIIEEQRRQGCTCKHAGRPPEEHLETCRLVGYWTSAAEAIS